MNIDDYLNEVLNEAAENISKEQMSVEMEDFMKIESHMVNDKQMLTEPGADVWYLTLDVDLDAPILNEEDRTSKEQMVLGLKYKYSYNTFSDALNDHDSIKEMKRDGAVGIIVRLHGVSVDGGDVVMSSLTTPNGVYLISRPESAAVDGISTRSFPRHKIVTGQNKIVDALIEAFFTW